MAPCLDFEQWNGPMLVRNFFHAPSFRDDHLKIDIDAMDSPLKMTDVWH
jgi:hypothetical protein